MITASLSPYAINSEQPTKRELINLRFGDGWRCAELPTRRGSCPCCAGELDQEHADVGVGVIYGPVGCLECGWSSWPEYDSSCGPAAAEIEHPGFYANSRGGIIRRELVDP